MKRKIVIHNHLPNKCRTGDDSLREQPVAELRGIGRAMRSLTTSAQVRAKAKERGYNRAEEAYIVDGWKQARIERGLSENV